jgi:glycosyltransferase involved in cell wall biosynthesis
MKHNKKLISIVTPVFNEEANVLECYLRTKELFNSKLSDYNYEHIFCDNHSNDNTLEILKKIALEDINIKIIVHSRNFGVLKSMFNGVINTKGDATLLFLPADLQDPIEILPDFIKKWEDGIDIVYGIRQTRSENFLLLSLRKIYYRVLSKVTYVDYPPDVGDYQLVDKKIVEIIKSVKDYRPFLRLMTLDCGFNSAGIKYNWGKREKGKSKFNLLSLISLGINGLISFSTFPLRFCLYIGIIIAFFSFSYGLYILLLTLFSSSVSPSGFPTLAVSLFFFSGTQLFFIGVLGEYIGAIYDQVRVKPLIIEKERVNF